MKRFFLVLLFCLLCYNMHGQARQVISMNSNWRFVVDDNQQYAQPSYNDQQWRTLNLPHDWSIEGKYDKSNPSGPMGGYMPCGTAWYRKHFTLPQGLQDKRFFIYFDGVYMKSEVWINGRMVGEYPNGYNSFEYDITPFINKEGENVLAIKVDNSLQPSSRWYTGSGIYRSVYLKILDQLHFENEGVFISTPQVSKQEASIHVDYTLINNNYPETRFSWSDNTSLYVWTRDENKPTIPQKNVDNKRIQKDCTLTSVLYDAAGKEVQRYATVHKIGDFSDYNLVHDLSLSNPKLWSPTTPNLYKLVSTIAYEGLVRDSIVNTVGIREFKYSAQNGMTLNGEAFKIQGVCVHQSVGCFGSAVPVDVWKERLLTLKEMGCNAIRTHYPLIPEFQDMCDSLGLLVSKEILDEWNRGQEWGYSESSYGKLAYTYHLYFDQWYDTDMRRMIRRDRNHPSVFMYNLGNEIPNQRIKGIDLARKIKAIVREEDPTRPVSAACDFFVGANIYGFMDELDIAGYNYIDRIHPDSLYAAEAARYPNRILLGSETYHKTRNHVSVRDTKSCIGEFIWVGFDYMGEIVQPDDRGWREGIIDIAGFPKPEYFLRKSYWSKEPVVHIAVQQGEDSSFDWAPKNVADHWNWEKKGVQALPIYVYSNCDEVELFLETKSLGRKAVSLNDYYARWDSPFKAGTIRAVGYRNGKKVSEHQLKTAAEPAELKVSRIWKGNETIRVEVEVVDKKGIRVPNTEYLVALSQLNNVQSLGFDNGNQHDPKMLKYTSKQQEFTADGRFVIYLRCTEKDKAASFSLAAEGLKGLNINL